MDLQKKKTIKKLIESYWWLNEIFDHIHNVEKIMREDALKWEITVTERKDRMKLLTKFKQVIREIHSSYEYRSL